jgi:hypothetical protein
MNQHVGVVLSVLFASGLMAQRAFEHNGSVVYEDPRGNRVDLGAGFSPVLTDDGGVALLRGRRFDYGEKFNCDHKETRNWVSVYNPKQKPSMFCLTELFRSTAVGGSSVYSSKCNCLRMARSCIS